MVRSATQPVFDHLERNSCKREPSEDFGDYAPAEKPACILRIPFQLPICVPIFSTGHCVPPIRFGLVPLCSLLFDEVLAHAVIGVDGDTQRFSATGANLN